MKITGNEDGSPISEELVTEANIESTSTTPYLSDTVLFGSLAFDVSISNMDFEKGIFQVHINASSVKDIPTISVSVDNPKITEDLFKNSDTSADNRLGIQEFIKAGVLQAITSSFSENTFNEHLQILDEKLKSKTLEIQQANIENGSLVTTEEVPNLVTSQEELEPSKIEESQTPVLKEQEDLKAEGYDEYSLDDDEVPESYKPLSDGTSDNQPLKASESVESESDDGKLESIAKLKY